MIGSKIPPGTKVRIVQDIRDGAPAAGQIAAYEGDFPLSVAIKKGGEWIGEFDYEAYESGMLLTKGGIPVKDRYPLWTGGPEPEHGRLAMPMDNPRFILEDGSKIWGAECWWEVAEGAPSLEESQADLEMQKAFLRGIFNAIAENSKDLST